MAAQEAGNKKNYANKSGRYCVVTGCHNSQVKMSQWRNADCVKHVHQKHMDCPCLIPYGFHRFPKNVDMKRQWVAAVQRKDFRPSMASRICSTHFADGRPTKLNPVPTMHLGKAIKTSTSATVLDKKEQRSCRTQVKKVIVPTVTASKMRGQQSDGAQSSTSQSDDVTFLWKGHHDFLAESLVDFKRRECQADANVTFTSPDADGRSEDHKVHRLILSIFLPTIKQSLETTGLPRLMTQLDLSNLAKEADDVRTLIEFIYTGEATVTEDRLEPLRRLAAALNFEGFLKTIDDCQQATVVDSLPLDGTSSEVQEEPDVVEQQNEGEMTMTSSTSTMQVDQ